MVFVYIKYGKFWSVSLSHFIKHKPLIFLKSGGGEFVNLPTNFLTLVFLSIFLNNYELWSKNHITKIFLHDMLENSSYILCSTLTKSVNRKVIVVYVFFHSLFSFRYIHIQFSNFYGDFEFWGLPAMRFKCYVSKWLTWKLEKIYKF